MTRWLPVILGMAGALGGGWLVGRWCFGLVLIAESAAVTVAALYRDDGEGPRFLRRPGEGRTLAEVLEHQRMMR